MIVENVEKIDLIEKIFFSNPDLVATLKMLVYVSQDNYVFRLRVGCHHEISLLKRVRSPTGMTQMVSTQDAQRLERDLVSLPKLTTALHG